MGKEIACSSGLITDVSTDSNIKMFQILIYELLRLAEEASLLKTDVQIVKFFF